jgi:SIR2-like domain
VVRLTPAHEGHEEPSASARRSCPAPPVAERVGAQLDPSADTHPTGALILGAGWSHVAGLPLTGGLFDRLAISMPGGNRLQYELVLEAYRVWSELNPQRNAEEFLADVFDARVPMPASCERVEFSYLAPVVQRRPTPADLPATVPWEWAVQAVQLRLAEPVWRRGPSQFDHNSSSLRYRAVLLSRPACRAHAAFWRALRTGFDVCGVVTTNYDLCAERAMRDRRARGADAFAFRYAAFDGAVRPVNSPYERERAKPTTPRGEIPLAKLHGSLNWSEENDELVIYPDFRPVWRRGGTAAIVPPLPEKRVPAWLVPVWSAAGGMLRRARRWIVVGYSLPPYDLAVRRLLAEASADGALESILLVDPLWRSLSDRWAQIAPSAQIHGFNDLSSATSALANATVSRCDVATAA